MTIAFIIKHLGISKAAARALQVLISLAIAFGAFKAWKSSIKDDIVDGIVIEEQAATIDQQNQDAENFSEDAESKEEHTTAAVKRELKAAEDFLKAQTRRVVELENENEKLKEHANNNPCLRKPWPDSLQRRGGFDLNDTNED